MTNQLSRLSGPPPKTAPAAGYVVLRLQVGKLILLFSVSNYVVNQLGLEYVVTIRMIIGFRLAIYSRVSMLLVMQQLLIRPLQHLRDPWPTRSSLIPKTSPGRPRRSTPIRPRSRKRKQARRDPVVSPRKSPRRPPRQSRRRPPRQSRRKLPRQSQTTTSFRRTRVVTNCMCASCACVIHMLHVRFPYKPMHTVLFSCRTQTFLSDSDDELLRKEKANLEEQLAKINSQLGSKGKKRKATKQEPLDAPDPPATPATEEAEALKRRGARRFDSQTSLSAEPSSRRRVRPSSAVPTSKGQSSPPSCCSLTTSWATWQWLLSRARIRGHGVGGGRA